MRTGMSDPTKNSDETPTTDQPEKIPLWKQRHLERAQKLESALHERRKSKATGRRLAKILLAEDAADIGQSAKDLKFKAQLLRQVELADAARAERERAIACGEQPAPKGGYKQKRSLRAVLEARDLSEKAMNAGAEFTRATDQWTGQPDATWDKLTRDEQRRLLLVDFREFCRHAKILTKKRERVPFKWNAPQRRMNQIILSMLAGKKPVRMRIAKARQWGATTDAIYLNLWMAHRHGDMAIAVVVHSKVPYVKAMVDRYLFAWRSLPEWFRLPMRATANRIEFDNGSFVDFFSAGTKATADQVCRSSTYQIQHLTEVPFWFAAQATLTACMQALVDGPNTIQIIESTPKGAGEFKDLYLEAKNGDSNAVAMFVAWHQFEGNRIKPTIEQQAAWVQWRETGSEGARQRGGFGKDEENRIGRFGLDAGQWLWWWYTLREKCGNNLDRMIQEHADDDITCFAVSGDTYFKRELLGKVALQCNALRYQWRSVGIANGEFDEGQRGYNYRRKPAKRHEYLAVLDPADGGASTSDPSVLYICRRLPGQLEVVAWCTHQGYANEVMDNAWPLLAMYGDPLLVIEANKGAAHILEARQRNYPRIYRRTRLNEVTGQPMMDQFGWFSGGSSRAAALQALAKYYSQDRLIAGIDVLHSQMGLFVKQGESEKYAAKGKTNDDHVICAAMACHIDDTLSNPKLDEVEPVQRVGNIWGIPDTVMSADPAPPQRLTQPRIVYYDND